MLPVSATLADSMTAKIGRASDRDVCWHSAWPGNFFSPPERWQ
jgi:hypothetical protein